MIKERVAFGNGKRILTEFFFLSNGHENEISKKKIQDAAHLEFGALLIIPKLSFRLQMIDKRYFSAKLGSLMQNFLGKVL